MVVVAEEEEEDWTEDAGGVVPVSFDIDAHPCVSLVRNNYFQRT